MARRRKLLPNTLFKTPDTRPAEQGVIVSGSAISCMGAPNHAVPVLASWRNPFPILEAVFSHDSHQPVFTDRQYGEPFYDYPVTGNPPTWFDPVQFLQMARAHEGVQDILEDCRQKNDYRPGLKVLAGLFDEVMDQKYLPYLLRMFEHAKPYLSEWLLLNYAARQLEEENHKAILQETAQNRRKRKYKPEQLPEEEIPDEGNPKHTQ